MTDAARDDHTTEVLGTGTPVTSAATVPRRRRPGKGWMVVLVILLVISALLVVADVVARGVAERQAAQQLEAGLPEGVEGEIDVSIGGFSVIAQYLGGSMDQVRLRAPELVVAGAPIDVVVELRDVPPALDGPVGRIDASVRADDATVDALVTLAGVEGGVTLGDGDVAYERSVEVLGIPLRVVVTATPVAAGDTVVLESIAAELVAGDAPVDVSSLVDRVVGEAPVAICVAEFLPEGARVDAIVVTESGVRVDIDASSLSLDERSLTTMGSCG